MTLRRGAGASHERFARFTAIALTTLTMTAAATQGQAQAQAQAPPRILGFTGSPATYAALHALRPSVHAQFVAFGTDWSQLLAEDSALSATPMVTWEPRHASLAEIAAGEQDAYLARVAREVAAHTGVVYIRFAHEMNGNWYPWGHHPHEYVAAWRHIWSVFHAAAATNARFIWAPDLIAGQPRAKWERDLAQYWPGSRYVNIIGTSLVTFAYQGKWPLSYRFASIDWIWRRFGKPFWLAEVKVDADQRYSWLEQLAEELRSRSWIAALLWSETPSLAQGSGAATGNMEWSLVSDPRARRLLTAAVDAHAAAAAATARKHERG